MIVIYCSIIDFCINTDHLTEENLRKCCKDFYYMNIDMQSSPKKGKYRLEDKDVIIISFKEAIIRSLTCMNNILIICPKVIFEDNCLIDLSNKNSPRQRNPNSKKNFYGLAGHSGYPGYNLAIICEDINIPKTITFISTGTPGGNGQEGQPGGVGGLGGTGGKLIINREVVKTGKNGDNGKDIGTNTIGIIDPDKNLFGLTSELADYRLYIHEGISELDLEHDKAVNDFFMSKV